MIGKRFFHQAEVTMARLIMRRGPQPGKVFELTEDVISIGSGMRNTITIVDADVSREHCRLTRMMMDYEVADLDSVRGTFVSGQRITGNWMLRPGHVIELGEHVTLEYDRPRATEELRQRSAESSNLLQSDVPDEHFYPSLVVMVGPNPGQVFPLKTADVSIGRDSTNDVVIVDPEISRMHLILHWKDNNYQLEDIGSTNGTTLNGVPVESKKIYPLQTDDVMVLATRVELRYTWEPEAVRREIVSISNTPGKLTTKELVQSDTAENQIFKSRTKRQTSNLGTGIAPGSLVDHIFIAYARPDWSTIVAPIVAAAQDGGFNTWVEQYLQPGQDDWTTAVEQALSECWMLLVVISPESMESRHIRLSYRYFFNRNKPVISLLYAGVHDLPPELKNGPIIRYDNANRKQTFSDLVDEIKRQRKLHS
jgi:pSer/pThr/pTyr-binding forkhead associated (FHA) protein